MSQISGLQNSNSILTSTNLDTNALSNFNVTDKGEVVELSGLKSFGRAVGDFFRSMSSSGRAAIQTRNEATLQALQNIISSSAGSTKQSAEVSGASKQQFSAQALDKARDIGNRMLITSNPKLAATVQHLQTTFATIPAEKQAAAMATIQNFTFDTANLKEPLSRTLQSCLSDSGEAELLSTSHKDSMRGSFSSIAGAELGHGTTIQTVQEKLGAILDTMPGMDKEVGGKSVKDLATKFIMASTYQGGFMFNAQNGIMMGSLLQDGLGGMELMSVGVNPALKSFTCDVSATESGTIKIDMRFGASLSLPESADMDKYQQNLSTTLEFDPANFVQLGADGKLEFNFELSPLQNNGISTFK